MAKTNTFTVDDANANPYTVLSICRKIIIRPQNGNATFDYRAPTATDALCRKFNGEPLVLERPAPGQYEQTTYGDPGTYLPGDKPIFLTNARGWGALTFQAEEYV